MTTADSNSHSPAATVRIWGIRLLSLVACGLGVFLLLQSDGRVVYGCDAMGGFNCGAALASPWSRWLGIPVAAVGAACYGMIFVASWLIGRRSLTADSTGWRMLELLTPVVAGAAVWFTGVQLIGSTSVCLYCLLCHISGLVLVSLIIAHRWSATRGGDDRQATTLVPGLASAGTPLTSASSVPPPSLGIPTLIGFTAVGALVIVQAFFMPSVQVIDAASIDSADLGEFSLEEQEAVVPSDAGAEEDSENAQADSETPLESSLEDSEDTLAESEQADQQEFQPQRTIPRAKRYNRTGDNYITLLDGKLRLNANDWPMLGSPQAEHFVLEVYDYGCPKCRELHKLMEKARQHYGEQLAIIVAPSPGELICNKYVRNIRPNSRGTCKLSQLAVAVSIADPNEFESVHQFIMRGEKMPSFYRALEFAKTRVNGKKLSETLRKPKTKHRLDVFIDLHAKLARVGGAGLPCQVAGKKLISGMPDSEETLREFWESNLPGLKPLN